MENHRKKGLSANALRRFAMEGMLTARSAIRLYDGRTGKRGRWMQCGADFCYPLHLLVAVLLCRMF